jgi:hypothetical protein
VVQPAAKRAGGYASLPNALAELSPGAAIRDTLDASGRMVRDAWNGDGWGAAGAGANMLTAMAGVVPGMRAAEKGAAKAAEAVDDLAIPAFLRRAPAPANAPLKDGLPMDEASRLRRAASRPGMIDAPLYHGTAAEGGIREFDPARAGKSTGSPVRGIWADENPTTAGFFAQHAAEAGGNPQTMPLVGYSQKTGTFDTTGIRDRSEIWANVSNAFEAGYDAVRLVGKDSDGKPVTQWAFKHPNQLRSRFAAFDPTKWGSSDLLAGIAGAAGAGSLAAALAGGLASRPDERY